MRIAIILSLFIFPNIFAEYTFHTKYIDIPLDHFSFTNNSTFSLKYLVNDTFYVEGRPIFFYAGNEGDINMFAQNTGFMFDIAPLFNALIVFAEHRYYGETLPFGNLSYTAPEYLGYLSSSQALADFVYLINELQKDYAVENLEKLPVIGFGGSYGGMLATWLKMKYPNSVTGVIASSAPIWMFKNENSCDDFYRIVTNTFQKFGGDKCTQTIKDSWAIVRSLTQNATGKSELSNLWNFCAEFTTEQDIETLVGWLSEVYVALAETNYPYPTSFLVPLPANPVKEFCNKITIHYEYNDDVGLLKAISEALQIYTNYTGTSKCNDLGSTSEELGEDGWNFQACTEMIMPLCSNDADIFENVEWDFQAHSDSCYQMFGVRPRSEEVPILEYGGKDLSAANNIVFSNGLLDPWSAYGVLRNYTSNIVAVVISEGAHHSDLRASNENDPESVQTARLIHINQISKWLDAFYSKNKI